MSELSHEALDALAPLRAFIATTAQNTAATTQQKAQTQVDALREDAEGERDRILAEAIDDGKHTAQAVATLRSARVRRQAAEVVLSQREAIRQSLLTRVEQAATALHGERRYPELHSRLVARGRALLGQDAAITEIPEGGILVETGSRRLDLSLPTLAMSTLEKMGTEVSSLWTR
jgi:hypothetical protein